MELDVDRALLAAAIISVLASLTTMVIALKNEKRRRVRSRFRQTIKEHLKTPPDVVEMRLADLLRDAIVYDHAKELRNVDIGEFLETYISDKRFRFNFYSFLVRGLAKNQRAAEQDRLAVALSAIETWRGYDDQLLQRAISAHLAQAERPDKQSNEINAFLRSRRSYFKDKVFSFVNDVEDGVKAAFGGTTLPTPAKEHGIIVSSMRGIAAGHRSRAMVGHE